MWASLGGLGVGENPLWGIKYGLWAYFGGAITGARTATVKKNRINSNPITADGFLYENEAVRVMLGKDYTAQNVAFKGISTTPVNLRQAAEMAILCQAARDVLPWH